jgi:hypothetical protein
MLLPSLPDPFGLTPFMRRFLYTVLLLLIPIILYWPQDWTVSYKSHSSWTSSTEPDTLTAPTPLISPSTSTSEPSSTAATSPAIKTLSPSYTRTLVVARLEREDVSWIQDGLPGIQTAIYVVDKPTDPYHIPTNKGHEAMVYLTYIIDHYSNLPDVSIFTHSDRFTWHNNDLLDSDLVKMLERLNSDRVVREGYMALRCHVQPGCSDVLYLNSTEPNLDKPEEVVFKDYWDGLHPGMQMPNILSAPCCGQFAASRDAILVHSYDQYLKWQEWLLNTDLSDAVAGRIWEYTWHYIFSGQAQFCPDPHYCYCDGYSVCFESKEASDAWYSTREYKRKLDKEYEKWKEARRAAGQPDTNNTLEQLINHMDSELDRLKVEAIARGDDPVARKKALESMR